MSAGKTDKPLRIKGLVKRCRSFKEDILSRLARNRSLGKEDGSTTVVKNQNLVGTSDGESPVPNYPNASSSVTPEPPHVSLPHRLKEAHLTLSFVESLIQKNCIDLLGGSSNVMLDLMGSLLNDVKKTSASGSAAYQSAISLVKSTLSDFLTAVDVLVLKSRCDDAQREVFFEKVLETLRSIREALTKLKTLVESKENGHTNFMGSTPVLTSAGISHSPKKHDSAFSNLPAGKDFEEKRPPLPPKLKQWTAKSFDLGFHAPRSSTSPSSSPLHHMHHDKHSNNSGHTQRHNSLLNQWLEQSSLNNNNTINTNSIPGSSFYHPQQSTSSHHQDVAPGISHYQNQPQEDSGKTWTDSSVYVARSSSASLSNNTNSNPDSHSRNRTFSDSLFGLGGDAFTNSEDSLDHFLPEETRSRATTHSQSLSLGSSLDNLLLVDSQSQHSGLSPNSMHKMSASSCNAGSSTSPGGIAQGHELAGLSAYDPDADGDVFEEVLQVKDEPPELPKKMRQFMLGNIQEGNSCDGPISQNGNRCPSPYDNVEAEEGLRLSTWHGERGAQQAAQCSSPSSRQSFQSQRQFMSYSESRNTLVGASGCGEEIDEKPPLPPKKKHSITAYVELMHNWDTCSSQNHHHHHFHNHQSNHTQQQHQPYHGAGAYANSQYRRGSVTLHNPSIGSLPGGGTRAAYSHSTSYHHFSSFSSTATSIFAPMSEEDSETNPSTQVTSFDDSNANAMLQLFKSDSNGSLGIAVAPPLLPPKKLKTNLGIKKSVSEHERVSLAPRLQELPITSPSEESPILSPISSSTTGLVVLAASTPIHNCVGDTVESSELSLGEDNLDLYIFDGSPNLVLSESPKAKSATESPEVKGGEPLILLVYAASPNLQDLKFREVFLLTYRTFLRPLDVVSLLWRRYQYFEKKTNDRISVAHGRATLDLLVDVINSLTPMDLDDDMINKVRGFIYHLVNAGEILSALKARRGLILKYEVRVRLLSPKPAPAALAVTVEPQSLLQWGATSIAQQMTLLDSELFRHLEPAELLLWAREQSEDFCPALNNFTEHFNKVSYWARSKVLLCSTSRERNRTMKKLIEVMRKLREYSNFNSLLAVLAALDSAPIRRLGFSRRLTEALKPHAALTDSSGSFRTYRQALSESHQPCIPYIGLVLQDLTFVHIGNADSLADGKVNWIKRWQQWVVLEPIRRFHACQYGYIRNDSLLTFLNNFDESLNDDDLWQLSEAIKPRGKN